MKYRMRKKSLFTLFLFFYLNVLGFAEIGWWSDETTHIFQTGSTYQSRTIISPKNGQKIPKITNLQYNKGRANYGTKKKSIYG